MPQPHLVVDKVRDLGQVTLADEPLTIGRSSQSALVLPSKEVSRNHCVIERADGAVRVRDLDSHFGTTVNGERVAAAALEDGDAIGIGPFRLIYVDPEQPRSGERPDEERDSLQRDETLAERELSTRAEELSRREAELAGREEALIRDRDALSGREKTLADREQALADETQSLETRRREHEEEVATRERRDAEAEAARAAALADLEDRSRRLADDRTAIDGDRETLREKSEELAREERELADRLRVLHGERDLIDAARKKLEADSAEVQRRAEAVEAAQQAEDATLVSLCRSLRTASEQVATARDDVSVLEALFLETDERLGEDEANGEVNAHDLRQREAIARKLEDAHELHDAAEDILQSVVEELCDQVAREKGHASADDRAARPFPWPGRRRK